MKKTKLILIISVCLIAIISAAIYVINNYSNNSRRENLNIVLGSEPNSLDPAISLTIDVRSYLSGLFEGLLILDEKGNLQPGVAESWSVNEKNTEYTFKLRKDAKWSDGTNVTANDFKYSWLRVLNPDTASGWASFLYYIKGAESFNNGTGTEEDVKIKVLDDYTLKVSMENPCSFFASMTTLQPYYPVKKSIVENNPSWDSNSKNYVSNGAFKLESWNHDEKITLIKNDNYWNKDNIKLSKVNYLLFSDSSTILNAYEANEIDFVSNMLTSDEMNQVDKVKNSEFVYTKFLALNLNNELLKDKNIRQAISLALDREEIAKIMGSNIEPLTTIIPSGFYNSSENIDYTKDSNSKEIIKSKSQLQKSMDTLKKSKYYNEKSKIKLVYLTNNSSTNIALSELVKEQLNKIGIDVEIQALDKKVFNEYRKDKKFDIVAASWAAEYPDISSYLYGFRSNDFNNYSSFSSEEFDNIYNDIFTTSDISKKFKLVHDAENLVINSYSNLPLYKENSCYIAKNDIDGYYFDVTGNLNINYVK